MVANLKKNPLWRDYLELTKPGVQALLFVTCGSGMLIASNFSISIELLVFGLLGISLIAASAATVNHIQDMFIDSKMERTSKRPLVKGSISKLSAISFVLILYLLGSGMLLIYVNSLTWVLTSLTFIFYAFIYTSYLKFLTSQNIVIGGIAGAMPPLLGWTAVTNSIEPNAWLLVLIIFAWTPPHFWALAINRLDDYKDAGVPMLPVQRGIPFTKRYIVLYTILLIIATLLPFTVDMFGFIYLVSALLLGSIFLYYSLKLYFDKSNSYAMKTFGFSIAYLALLFLSMLFDRFLLL